MKSGVLKEEINQIIIKSLFGETLSERLAGLILLAKSNEPEVGWLLEAVLSNKQAGFGLKNKSHGSE